MILILLAILLNALAAIFTGVASYIQYVDGNYSNMLLEALLCIFNIILFTINIWRVNNGYY